VCYSEMGEIYEVEVIEHKQDDEGESYTLKHIGTIRNSGRVKPMADGTVFTVWRAHDAGGYAGWSLQPNMLF